MSLQGAKALGFCPRAGLRLEKAPGPPRDRSPTRLPSMRTSGTSAAGRPDGQIVKSTIGKAPLKDRFLHVQAVFRFVPDR